MSGRLIFLAVLGFMTVVPVAGAAAYESFPFPSSCDFDQEIDESAARSLLSEVAVRIRENKESICFWGGRCIIKEKQNGNSESGEIVFYVDSFHAQEAFLSSSSREGSGKQYRFYSGRIINERDVFHFMSSVDESKPPLITVGYSGSEKSSLNPDIFSPICLFRIVGKDSDSFFSNLDSCFGKDWFRYRVERSGPLIRVAYGNKSLDVPDTELVFDTTKSCNLVTMINPGPEDERRVEIRYTQVDGVWLPVLHRTTTIDSKSESSVIIEVFDHQINTPIESQKFTPAGLFPVAPGNRLFDNRTQTQHVFDSDLKFMTDTAQQAAVNSSNVETRKSVESKTFLWKFLTINSATFVLSLILWRLLASKSRSRNNSQVSWKKLLVLSAISVAIVSVASLFASSNSNAQDGSRIVLGDPQCAHYCIARVCGFLGVEFDPETIVLDLPPNKLRGNSVQEVQKYFKKIGVETVFKACAFTDLNDIQAPCVVHLSNPDHYVVVSRSEVTGELFAIDGISVRRLLELDELAARWGKGVIFVHGQKPSDQSAKSQLKFSRLLDDKGWLPMDKAERIVSRFEFINLTSQPVKIKKLIEDCDCIESQYSTNSVSPGDKGFVELAFAPLKRSSSIGNFEHSVYAVFEGGESIRLQVTGSIALPLSTTTKVANFGTKRLPPSAQVVNAEAIIPVILPGRKVSQVSWNAKSDQLANLTLEVSQKGAQPNSGVVKVRTSTPLTRTGNGMPVKGFVKIIADQSELELPIRLLVRPEIEVYPKSLRIQDSSHATCWIYSFVHDFVVSKASSNGKEIAFRLESVSNSSPKALKLTIASEDLSGVEILDLEISGGPYGRYRRNIPVNWKTE